MISRSQQSRFRFFSSSFIFLLIFIVSGCNQDDESDNQGPNAKIIAPLTLTYTAGETVSVDGSSSSDPDGDILSYQWTVEGAGITLSDSTNSSLTFVAPTVSQRTQLIVQLTVGDGVLTSTDSTSIWVSPSIETGIKEMYIDHYKSECYGLALSLCMRNRYTSGDDWSLFHETIEGFEYEWGYSYKLKVNVESVERPAEDASSVKYTLNEILSKELAPIAITFDISASRASGLVVNKSPGIYELYGEKEFSCSAQQCASIESLVTQDMAILFEFSHNSNPNDALPLSQVKCSSSRESFMYSCLADNRGKVSIDQGIWGNVWFLEGNHMPVIGEVPSTGTTTAVSRNIYIYEATLLQDTSENSPGFFNKINSELITVVESDLTGFYQAELPVGNYSIFVEENGAFYANGFDSEGVIAPVTIEEDTVSTHHINIDYAASY